MAGIGVSLEPIISISGLRRREDALVPFRDYSRWERKPTKLPASSKPSLSLTNSPKTKSRTPSIVHQQAPAPPTSTSNTAVIRLQPVCTHGQGGKRKYRQGSLGREQTDRPSGYESTSNARTLGSKSSRSGRSHDPVNVRLLRVQLAARSSSLEEYCRYKDELLSDNIALMTSIEQVEEQSNSSTNELLGKYRKFKGAISTLKQKSSQQLIEAQSDLDATKSHLDEEIKALRTRISLLDAILSTSSKEMQVLLHYKDKEYPLKIVRMEQLREQRDILRQRNEVELAEVEMQVAEEREKCEHQMATIKMSLDARATEAALSTMKKSIHHKAIQNRIMEKEIEIHKGKTEELRGAVNLLKSSIRQVKQAVKEKMSSNKKHPLAACGKCLPDTDFRLNIPIQDHLPV